MLIVEGIKFLIMLLFTHYNLKNDYIMNVMISSLKFALLYGITKFICK
jgi:hypothetical protein